MFFFLKLAFKSILKNKRNTFTIVLVVFIGAFFMEFLFGYMDGFKQKMADDALQQTGHIGVYNKKYYNNLDFAPIEYNIHNYKAIIKKIMQNKNVMYVRPEINFGAMANSKIENSETMVEAIDYKNDNPI